MTQWRMRRADLERSEITFVSVGGFADICVLQSREVLRVSSPVSCAELQLPIFRKEVEKGAEDNCD